MRKNLVLSTLLVGLLLFSADLFSQALPDNFKELSPAEQSRITNNLMKTLRKSLQDDERHDRVKETTITGNLIRVLVTNQGSISTPASQRDAADLFWPIGGQGLGYGYEFGPLVGATVVDANGDSISFVSDGILGRGDRDPVTLEPWGWEPKLGFSDPNSNEVATIGDLDRDNDSKPDSWPVNWYNETLGRYVWPAFLGDDATAPDEEVYFVMDDWDNQEFAYYPSPGDSSIRGLGLELQVRIFQFNNALAEDMIFLVYTVTNVGEKDLYNVHLGMFGDPHVGGGGDASDDFAGFISAFNENFDINTRNMLYAYDEDGRGDRGLSTGYFGYRFLESPGLSNDGFDNDDDQLLDENQFNDAGSYVFRSDFGRYRSEPGFAWTGDEDGDWDPEFDDVGVDGIANTRDFGEGDGKPNQRFYLDSNNNGILDDGELTSESRLPGMRFDGGEPNFGFLDVAESDQLGLTSFNALPWASTAAQNDPLMWSLLSTRNQREGDPDPVIQQDQDNVYVYGCGPFNLAPGESQRFSIVLLMGENFEDLLSNARISQQIFESDYRFAQAPRKPTLVAVPGDGKVTLYWNDVAETSFDPFISRANPDDPDKGFDFEGYRIYRSRDYTFFDTQTITDSRGIRFLSVPLNQTNGLPAQFDLENEYLGLSDIEYIGRGVRYYLGNNTGLVHSFVDSNNVVNGVRYYYAITSYDHGDVEANIAPTESQRIIDLNTVDRTFIYDLNTASVVPGPPASGYQDPEVENGSNTARQIQGDGTGSIVVDVLNPLEVQDNKEYQVSFVEVDTDDGPQIGFSILDPEVRTAEFVSLDTVYVSIGAPGSIFPGSVNLTNAGGNPVDTSLYQIDYLGGRIRGRVLGDLPRGNSYTVSYQLAPVSESLSLNSEDNTPVFDGVRVLVEDEVLRLSPVSTNGGKSGFKTIATNTTFSDSTTTISVSPRSGAAPIAADYEIRFTDYDTTATGEFVNPADSSFLTNIKTNFRIIDLATGNPIQFFFNEPTSRANGRWDWDDDPIDLLRPGTTQASYRIKFTPPPPDTLVDDSGRISLDYDLVYPGAGDVFLLFSEKPFDTGDVFTFSTQGARFENPGKQALDEIYVVPNPYVAQNSGEELGLNFQGRLDRRIEFRNLPPKCTIRIYTVTGELIATLDKDDSTSALSWNMLTYESQEIAYGVYIFHVDAPGVGTKIGRFGVIK
ncbi:MAG: hypothetical protein KDI06_03520 [Calditrichaeota bacterium]|nr:hypothetical protein [Calditrichota bacterium]